MNRVAKYTIAGAGTLALAAAAFGAATVLGVLPFGNSDEHPPCDQLPQKSEVQSAIESHADLVDTLQRQGDDVSVSIGTPCSSPAAAALVQVSYGNSDERSKIETVLTKADGFGVPVSVVHR
ncbi:hypothetical protein KK090_02525 [Curtobacterium flaccumfaciens pv. poinsettiae]|uniref:hypothetical protein n=1 Tax=Curtobacterium poinsettiae TaxID=159612 RepID=UPI001BE0C187|nr:hypothetical protein [Curtobacterium flaccumfaciens]MBT1618123.1 hypothetical protein [Curtobacterium flaccumfaciens pv. poinsettiae]